MTQNVAKSKRNGFLLFVFGCIIAVSGAAKLNEGERMIRIRQMSEGFTHHKVRKSIRALAIGKGKKKSKLLSLRDTLIQLEKKKPKKYAKLVRKDIRVLLQHSYGRLVADAAKVLHIRQPQAGIAVLKPKFLQAIALKLLPLMRSMPDKSSFKKKRRAKKPKLSSELTTAMTNLLMGKKPKAAKKKRDPKAVSDSLTLLVDQAVRHLAPYIVWEALIAVTMQKIQSVAKKKASVLSVALLPKLQKELSHAGAKKLLVSYLSGMTRDTGKSLKLKSKQFAFKPNEPLFDTFAKAVEPILTKERASFRLNVITKVFAKQISAAFALYVAHPTALKLRFVFAPILGKHLTKKQPSAQPITKKIANKRQAKPTSRPAMRKRPSSQPAFAVKSTSFKSKIPASRALLLATAKKNLFAWPMLRPQRVAFSKSTKRIGGWPNSVPLFIFGSFLAFLGLLSWRRAIAIEVKARLANQKEDDSNPFTLLKNLQEPLRKLQEDVGELSEEALCDRVDELLEGYVLPFAEVRRGVIEHLGMTDGAEILVTVAFGERMLNRVWSAASDQHLPEARSVLPDAVDAFAEAQAQAETSLSRLS